MEKIRTGIFWAITLSETSHVFCCVLPTLFSLASLLAGVGIVSALPTGWLAFHEAMHEYEIPMIGLSGAILAVGWLLHYISLRIDCHDTGCAHGPCQPKKKSATGILKIATVLFVVNTIIYLAFHAGHPGFLS